ncbi:MAG: aminodeoxychorismate synthase component I [Planctomycetota bacterium]
MISTAPVALEPLVEELSPAPDPVVVFSRLARLPHAVFLDSAQRTGELGRYSFVAADPFDWVEAPADEADALALLAERLAAHAAPRIEGLPPFQGGAAGLLGYELGRSLESVPAARYDEFRTPALAVGLYDTVVAFDHREQRCWLISHGLPEQDLRRRRRRAEERMACLRSLLEPHGDKTSSGNNTAAAWAPGIEALAPQQPAPGRPGVTSDFSREAYLAAVARAVEYIHAGDVFQVNLSQRLLMRATSGPVEAYLALRQRNPAPFAGYFDLGGTQVASASPERFLSVRNRRVETRPIKGTRRRSADPTEDRRLAEGLLTHEKDHAENVMIVDLLRNDLSRVCKPESIQVPSLCRLETYEHVHHLVSVVTGELSDGASPINLLRASFPGGSITGAPKVRAMEIISELEPTARGPYCGSLFYLGFNGQMDSSILIRTLVASRGWLQASVGGGVVADSDPAGEYEETWHKANGLLGVY